MKPKLEKLRDQVVVITGASSGIGLVTARRAAAAGAKVVLAARNEAALRDIVTRLHERGHTAVYEVADVASEADVRRLADCGHERGDYEGRVMKTSLYTTMARRPVLSSLLVGGAVLALAPIGLALLRDR